MKLASLLVAFTAISNINAGDVDCSDVANKDDSECVSFWTTCDDGSVLNC